MSSPNKPKSGPGLAAGLAAVLALAGTAAFADAAGEAEYMAACAACHGESGMGVGPMSEYLTVEAPALTRLSADNDGEFPMLKVIQIIDGRTGVRGHGGQDMPVWGALYKSHLEPEAGDYAAEIETRGRILSLALYLESIQE